MVDNNTHVQKIFDNVPIAASGTEVSTTVKLDVKRVNGYFKIYYEITGDGTLSFTAAEGIGAPKTPLIPSGATAIVTGVTKTAGTGGDGVDSMPVTPTVTPELAISATETGTSDGCVINMWIVYQ